MGFFSPVKRGLMKDLPAVYSHLLGEHGEDGGAQWRGERQGEKDGTWELLIQYKKEFLA